MPILSDSFRDWSLVATVIKDLSRSKIVNLGRRFESQYLIVRVSSREQKDTWNYGGKLWTTSLVLGKEAKIHQIDLDLFEQELIQVPKLFDGKYSLLYQAPRYFPDVTLKVWEHRGEIINETEQIDLTSIENKLDGLANLINFVLNNLDDSYLKLTNELGNTLNQITAIQNSLSTIDLNIGTQLLQLEAGIFTLFQSVRSLIPESKFNQLETDLRFSLELNEEFL
ncbi:MAG: hypothetical protein QNJ65_11850 [Xenococcaceae cyanobacterium MO_234.B1]|nr:hypothetical protein [Xenococcaceae cyanobacterium MO_234.B1]